MEDLQSLLGADTITPRNPLIDATELFTKQASDALSYQIPLSLPVILNSSAAAVARPGSKLRRKVF